MSDRLTSSRARAISECISSPKRQNSACQSSGSTLPMQAKKIEGMAKRPDTREILAKNLDYLMDREDFTTARLAAKSGVSVRSIRNMLNKVYSPTLENIDAIAGAFGLSGWQLIKAGLMADLYGLGVAEERKEYRTKLDELEQQLTALKRELEEP